MADALPPCVAAKERAKRMTLCMKFITEMKGSCPALPAKLCPAVSFAEMHLCCTPCRIAMQFCKHLQLHSSHCPDHPPQACPCHECHRALPASYLALRQQSQSPQQTLQQAAHLKMATQLFPGNPQLPMSSPAQLLILGRQLSITGSRAAQVAQNPCPVLKERALPKVRA